MKYKFEITGLDCPNCAAKLSSLFEKTPGVSSSRINFLTEKLTVEAELEREALISALEKCALGFDRGVKIK